MNDDHHFNFWEKWVEQSVDIKEFNSLNSLWLNYFIMGSAIKKQETPAVFK
jgi:hypothetical protein